MTTCGNLVCFSQGWWNVKGSWNSLEVYFIGDLSLKHTQLGYINQIPKMRLWSFHLILSLSEKMGTTKKNEVPYTLWNKAGWQTSKSLRPMREVIRALESWYHTCWHLVNYMQVMNSNYFYHLCSYWGQ